MISVHAIPKIIKKPVMLLDLNTHIRKIGAALSAREGRVNLPGLKGSAPAYIISRLLQQQKSSFLVILPDTETAEEWSRELRFYAGRDDAVLYFPPWEAAPFDPVSPHPNIIGERLHTLFKLMDSSAPLVVTTTIAAICQKLLPRQTLGEVSQYLVAGEEADRDALLMKLLNLGYSNVPLVEDRGTFSVRGGILDIFPPDRQAPVRIEFFGDFVETIREFDPVSQRSLHTIPELILFARPGRIRTDTDRTRCWSGRGRRTPPATGRPPPAAADATARRRAARTRSAAGSLGRNPSQLTAQPVTAPVAPSSLMYWRA